MFEEVLSWWVHCCAGPVWSTQRGGSGVSGATQGCAGAGIWQLPVSAAQGLSPADTGRPDDLLWCVPVRSDHKMSCVRLENKL